MLYFYSVEYTLVKASYMNLNKIYLKGRIANLWVCRKIFGRTEKQFCLKNGKSKKSEEMDRTVRKSHRKKRGKSVDQNEETEGTGVLWYGYCRICIFVSCFVLNLYQG